MHCSGCYGTCNVCAPPAYRKGCLTCWSEGCTCNTLPSEGLLRAGRSETPAGLPAGLPGSFFDVTNPDSSLYDCTIREMMAFFARYPYKPWWVWGREERVCGRGWGGGGGGRGVAACLRGEDKSKDTSHASPHHSHPPQSLLDFADAKLCSQPYSIIRLKASDFAKGTVRITCPGYYMLVRGLEPHSHSQNLNSLTQPRHRPRTLSSLPTLRTTFSRLYSR